MKSKLFVYNCLLLLSNITVVKQETAKTMERPMSQASNNSSSFSGIRLPILDNPPPPPPPEQQSPYAMGGGPPQQSPYAMGGGPPPLQQPPYGGPPPQQTPYGVPTPSHYAPPSQHQNPQMWSGGANYPPPSQSGHYSGYHY